MKKEEENERAIKQGGWHLPHPVKPVSSGTGVFHEKVDIESRTLSVNRYFQMPKSDM
jgi:hypothetical protein